MGNVQPSENQARGYRNFNNAHSSISAISTFCTDEWRAISRSTPPSPPPTTKTRSAGFCSDDKRISVTWRLETDPKLENSSSILMCPETSGHAMLFRKKADLLNVTISTPSCQVEKPLDLDARIHVVLSHPHKWQDTACKLKVKTNKMQPKTWALVCGMENHQTELVEQHKHPSRDTAS